MLTDTVTAHQQTGTHKRVCELTYMCSSQSGWVSLLQDLSGLLTCLCSVYATGGSAWHSPKPLSHRSRFGRCQLSLSETGWVRHDTGRAPSEESVNLALVSALLPPYCESSGNSCRLSGTRFPSLYDEGPPRSGPSDTVETVQGGHPSPAVPSLERPLLDEMALTHWQPHPGLPGPGAWCRGLSPASLR